MNDDLDTIRRVLAADVESAFRRLVMLAHRRPLLTHTAKRGEVDVMRFVKPTVVGCNSAGIKAQLQG